MATETTAKMISLYERINRVKKAVDRIKKTGKNQHFGYMFATESDIADSLRPLMAEHGVCLVYHGPDPDKFKMESAGKTSKGADKFRYQVWCRYSVVNAEDPAERFELWGYGEALDQEDKGHNKAITNAHKYVHIKLFDVSTGDLASDPDSVGHPDVPAQPQRPVAPKAPANPERAELKRVLAQWADVKPEDMGAVVAEVARRNGIKGPVKDLGEEDCRKLSAFCKSQMAAGVEYMAWAKEGGK